MCICYTAKKKIRKKKINKTKKKKTHQRFIGRNTEMFAFSRLLIESMGKNPTQNVNIEKEFIQSTHKEKKNPVFVLCGKIQSCNAHKKNMKCKKFV